MKMSKKTIGIIALAVAAIIALAMIIVCLFNRDTSTGTTDNNNTPTGVNEFTGENIENSSVEPELTAEQLAFQSWLDARKIEVTASLNSDGMYTYKSDTLGTLTLQDGLQVDSEGNVYSVINLDTAAGKAWLLSIDNFAEYVTYLSTGFPADLNEDIVIPSDEENPPLENQVGEDTQASITPTDAAGEEIVDREEYEITLNGNKYNFAEEDFFLTNDSLTWDYMGVTEDDGFAALIEKLTNSLGEASTATNDAGDITEYSWTLRKGAYILVIQKETEDVWCISSIPTVRN